MKIASRLGITTLPSRCVQPKIHGMGNKLNNRHCLYQFLDCARDIDINIMFIFYSYHCGDRVTWDMIMSQVSPHWYL